MKTSVASLANVKKKSVVMELLPWLGKKTATAIYPNIYLPSSIYANLHSPNPDPYNIALVIHEQEHIKRATEYGYIRWYSKYFFSPRFRLEEELAATLPQFAYLKNLKLTYNLERKAHALSSWLYLRPVSYQQALKRVNKLWASL